MSHVPEKPPLYVCRNCQNVYVGDVSKGLTPEDHTDDPPETCAACEHTEFVEIEDYPHVR